MLFFKVGNPAREGFGGEESCKGSMFGGERRGGEFSEKPHSIPPSWSISKNISQVTILRHEILSKGTCVTVGSPKLPK